MKGWASVRRCVAIIAAIMIASAPVLAEQEDIVARELDKYRQMMRADPWSNPANLDADRGAALWRTPAGPKNVSLEQCDLGLGAGRVDGAFAALPRYFADAGRVMDVETRILWCRDKLQGIDNADYLKDPHPEPGAPVKDVGAIATWIASRSAGMTFSAKLDHAREREAVALGRTLFNRRMGPLDFACASCHGTSGKRIRLQPLPALATPAEARMVAGEWPAYRVSTSNVMTMQHRIFDCFWQMRLPRVEMGSEATTALIAYLVDTARGGEIAAPGMKR